MTASTAATIRLPAREGWREVVLPAPRQWRTRPGGFRSRVAFAAAHVVADPRGDNGPGRPAVVDWDQTLAFRRHLFSFGFGVAEAMDTAQRNMGLDYPAVCELIQRSAAQAHDMGARIASGAGTDHLDQSEPDLRTVIGAYLKQVEMVETAGSQVILMASRHLASCARSADDYLHVYDAVLTQVAEPVILHWLGEVFDPQLSGYWGTTEVDAATDTFVELVRQHANRIDGVKVSLLSADHERELRNRLPDGVKLYTGDDFNYPELIRGDGERHSDALLGAFAGIAPAACAALTALDGGDLALYDAEMNATLKLSRTLFESPTYYYKTGITFLSWIRGLQDGFTMIGGLQSARPLIHLGRVLELAAEARLLPDPDLAAARMELLLRTAGIES